MSAPEHVAERPTVVRTTAGTVMIECSGPHATVLAKILAHYDAILAQDPTHEPAQGYTAEVWHHVLIRLLSETAHLRTPVAETVNVDTSTVDGSDDPFGVRLKGTPCRLHPGDRVRLGVIR